MSFLFTDQGQNIPLDFPSDPVAGNQPAGVELAVPPRANGVCVGRSPLEHLFPFTQLVMGIPAIAARDLDCEEGLV